MAELIITKENFNDEVIKSELPVLVDFWANWCVPCKRLIPIIDEIAVEYEGRIKVGKINVDEETSLAQMYGINNIPSIYLFKKGEVVAHREGFVQKEPIEEMFDCL